MKKEINERTNFNNFKIQKKQMTNLSLIKCILVYIMMLLSTIFLFSCSNDVPNSDKIGQNKILVYGSPDYTAINPALQEHGEINSLIFSGLFKFDEENYLREDLVDDWQYSQDRLTYVFHIKEEATFHDGQSVKAEDVKFTLETILNPENGSEIASNYQEIEEIKIIDENSLEIQLKTPNVAFVNYLTVGILPKHLLDGKNVVTDAFNQRPVGSGPYMLTEWDLGQSITLEKNKTYYGKIPNIDKIIFKIVEDTDARALQLAKGELHLAQITPQHIKSFEGKEDYQLYIMKTADYRGIMYNFNNPLFRNHPELPYALSFAIDREAIIDGVLQGYGQPAYSPLQKGPFNNPHIEKFSYDPQKTKALLEADGWQKGESGYYEKDGQQLAFTINNGQGDQVRIHLANLCAQNFQEIGINAKVAVNAVTDWEGQETYLIGWGSPFDPDDHTFKVFGTDKGANYSSYSNPMVDQLLIRAREAQTTEERILLYKEFQDVLTKNPPYTFIAYLDAIYVAKDNLKGITKNKVLGHHGVGIFWNVEEWDLTN